MSSTMMQNPKSGLDTRRPVSINLQRDRNAPNSDPPARRRIKIGAILFKSVMILLLLTICGLQFVGWKSIREWRSNDQLVQNHVAVIQTEVTNLRALITANSTEKLINLKILVLNSKVPNQTAREIASAVYKHATRNNRDPDLILSIMKVESAFDPKAVSSMGAIGLMQVMPHWVDVLDIQCELTNPDCNVKYGLQILASYEQLYGDLDMALTAFNRGPGPVDYALLKGKSPDNGYAGKIRAVYDRLRAINGEQTKLEVAYTK